MLLHFVYPQKFDISLHRKLIFNLQPEPVNLNYFKMLRCNTMQDDYVTIEN